jgi:hypothetical protein
MTYSLHISKDGEIVAERNVSADEVISILAKFTTAEAVAEPKSVRTSNKRGATKDNAGLRSAGTRRHPLTSKIEDMLIEGKSVVEITEQCEASAPTIYTIKARLKSEVRMQ